MAAATANGQTVRRRVTSDASGLGTSVVWVVIAPLSQTVLSFPFSVARVSLATHKRHLASAARRMLLRGQLVHLGRGRSGRPVRIGVCVDG
jgi:hypothetical protein